MFDLYSTEGLVARFETMEAAVKAVTVARREAPTLILEIKKQDIVVMRVRGNVEMPLQGSAAFFAMRNVR